jgi:iron complex transport system substrate-binding protein
MLQSRRALAVLFGLSAMLIGADTGRAAETSVVDATGRRVVVSDASRIVSIGGAVTEILYALDLQDHVVAIDSTSLFPLRAREKPNVGYMRQLSAEGVLGLNPSLVLASEGSGPKETMAVLTAASVPLVVVPDRFTGEGVVDKVRVVSQAAGAPARGDCLAAAVGRDLASLSAVRQRITKPKKVLFVLSFMNGRPMVAGGDTAADGIIKLAGAVNAISGYQGYKQVSDEAVISAAPDVVLVMERSQGNLDAETVFQHPAFSLTPAAAKRAFISIEGLYLLGFGPRTALAARDLAGTIYPDLAQPRMPSEQASAAECH